MKKLKNFSFFQKRVLVRCDFNVSFDEKGRILDGFRIKATIPTIRYLLAKKARLVLLSHLSDKNASLKPVAERLGKLLNKKVEFLKDWIGQKPEGEIVLLENLRFCKGEEENRESFAKDLARLGDVFINDAFGVCHRNHASVVSLPKFLPSFSGFLLEKEIKNLSRISRNPKRPLLAIIGGAKAETKVKLIDKISEAADFVLINGLLKKELRESKVCLKNLQKTIMPREEGQDIGEKDIGFFCDKIKTAKTIFWNGPFGRVEKKEFQKGTLAIARAIIKSRAFSVVGGGETIWFLDKKRLINKFSHISTGGGAMLAYLSGEKLPGLEALKCNGD
ncbi:MAG: phosphoglycerate kinase [bacterium]